MDPVGQKLPALQEVHCGNVEEVPELAPVVIVLLVLDQVLYKEVLFQVKQLELILLQLVQAEQGQTVLVQY